MHLKHALRTTPSQLLTSDLETRSPFRSSAHCPPFPCQKPQPNPRFMMRSSSLVSHSAQRSAAAPRRCGSSSSSRRRPLRPAPVQAATRDADQHQTASAHADCPEAHPTSRRQSLAAAAAAAALALQLGGVARAAEDDFGGSGGLSSEPDLTITDTVRGRLTDAGILQPQCSAPPKPNPTLRTTESPHPTPHYPPLP